MCYALIIIKYCKKLCTRKNINKYSIEYNLSYSLEDIGLEIRIKFKDKYYIGKVIGFDEDETEYIIKFNNRIYKSKIKDYIINDNNEMEIEYKEEEIKEIHNKVKIKKTPDKLLNSKEDIGLRVKIYWPVPYGRLRHGNIEKYDKWYSGIITDYNQKSKKHTINYDDGDIRKYLLQYKEFVFID